MSDCKHEKFGGDHHCCNCGGYAPDIVQDLQREMREMREYVEPAKTLIRAIMDMPLDLEATTQVSPDK